MYSQAQVEGWKKVTKAVHAEGGIILLQLWHVGRISDPLYLDDALPVSASAIKPAGTVSLVRPKKEFVTPRALTIEEIKQTIQDYRQAAIHAKEAGFDGVEIHGANGYLLDQFLQDSTNKRTDEYGGSLQNRAKLMLEVTDVVTEVWGSSKVGMHLAPRCDAHDMGDSNPLETFTYIATELGKRQLAFICARANLGDDNLAGQLKKAFNGNYIINQGLDQKTAEQALEHGEADAAAWGQAFIANPDLVKRFAKNIPLNAPKPELFYMGDHEGYTDYRYALEPS